MSWWDRRRKAKRAEKLARADRVHFEFMRRTVTFDGRTEPMYVEWSVLEDPSTWTVNGKPDASKTS